VSTDEQPEEKIDDVLDVHYPAQSLASLSVSLLLILVCRPKFIGAENTHKEMLSLFQNAQGLLSLANSINALFQRCLLSRI
jgi:hypothetical protein